MDKRTIDRRVGRTRTLLQNGLISLLSKKSYEAITVEDICDAADVGRSTFYAHYTSKDDLKRSSIDDRLRTPLIERQREMRIRPGSDIDVRFSFSLAMFEHARDHKGHYRALVGGRGGAVALGAIRQILHDLIREELASGSNAPPETLPRDLAVQFVVGAYMAVLTWWLDSGAKQSPHQVDAMFRKLATEGVFAGAPEQTKTCRSGGSIPH